jgi:5-oxoprolinase (ATP-hydrolysing)
VLATNHPQLAGGSHLPDITVITPVFSEGRIQFFVASRGHHADVGGITPGSMPPNSHSLVEEGAAILSFKLVRGGAFQVRALWPVSFNSATPISHAEPERACALVSFHWQCSSLWPGD